VKNNCKKKVCIDNGKWQMYNILVELYSPLYMISFAAAGNNNNGGYFPEILRFSERKGMILNESN
jgi:hypothetical protein